MKPPITPEQKRRNKKTGLVLAAFVIAIFVYVMVRGAEMFANVGPF